VTFKEAVLSTMRLFKPNVDKLMMKGKVKRLIKALADSDYDVRRKAAQALGSVKDSSAVEPLIKALADSDGILRHNAAGSLGNIKDRRAVEPLCKALVDSEPTVRYWATYALGVIEAANALSIVKDSSAVEPLIKALADSDKRVRCNVIEALGSIKDGRAVDPLSKALTDPDYAILRRAVEALGSILGSIKDSRVVEPLIRALADSDNDVRCNAAEALGSIKDSCVVEPLIRALADSDNDVRCKAAEALGNIEDDRTVEPLINALADPDHDVRRKAARALGNIKAFAIGQIRTAWAVERLRVALNDEVQVVRKVAAEVLIKIGGKEATDALIPYNPDRWRESGQPQLWVNEHRGQWNHGDWLSLLESLKRSEYWPMEPNAIGGVLEEIKREWHVLEGIKRERHEEEKSWIYGNELKDLRVQFRKSGHLICIRCQQPVWLDVNEIEREIMARRGAATGKEFLGAIIFQADFSKGLVCKNCKSIYCGQCSIEMKDIVREMLGYDGRPICIECHAGLDGIDHITD